MKFLATILLSIIIISPTFADNFSIYLVRHAEKQTSANKADKDPDLTECGQQRAKQLAQMLSEIKLSAVYSTPYQRTLATATPTVVAQKLPLKQYSPKHLQELAVRLKAAGKNTLVVGHSNTTPMLAATLSGQKITQLSEDNYQMLYQVSFIENEVMLTTLKQGFVCQPTNQ
ncbi:SixA phosphatase family protein [Thalassotalea sp. PLHSN55]|uniref:SixA phosphatase family protein n=1 Tax=Thalassotalea sp. PLHSN55 TaxID=3435888 RepID=UPI003F82C8A9